MKAVASMLALLLCVQGFRGGATANKTQRGRATNHCAKVGLGSSEANKDANALARLLAESLVYDYDGSVSTKQRFLASVKSATLPENRSTTRA